ncbi:hypothetical protein PG987_003090 [Apiospora arundinis]
MLVSHAFAPAARCAVDERRDEMDEEGGVVLCLFFPFSVVSWPVGASVPARGLVAQLHLSTHETLLTSRQPKPPASRTQCLTSRAMPAYRRCSTKGQRRALKHATSVTAELKSPRWANGEEKEPWRVLVDKQRSALVSE